MNITELIVAFVNQGNTVEMPGIGTLCGSHHPAYMDGAAQTFHAERNSVAFSNETSGNNDIVKYLAETECVDIKIAQLMWKNYIDALTEKLSRTGSHNLAGLGEIRLTSGTYQFLSEAGTAPTAETGIIADVKRYDTEHNDPFAAFDTPVEAQPEPKPEPAPIPEAIPTPELKPEHNPQPEPKPEPIPEPDPEPEPIPEPTAIPQTPTAVSIPVPEEKPTTKTLPENDTPTEKQADTAQSEEDIFAGIAENQHTSKKKRHRGMWLWLLLLLLLLLGGGYYYYTHYYQAGQSSTAKTTTTATTRTIGSGIGYEDQINIFTFNTDLLEYTPEERSSNREQILCNLQEYWSQFLNSRHYSHALPYLQESLSEYIGQRLSELLDHEGYSVQRFFTFDDYLHQFFYNELKDSKASKARATIQSELMDYSLLDEMLRQVVEENNLTATDVGKAVVVTPKQEKQVIYTAPMEKSSKKGFDVIAGFYTSQQSAHKMATRLKNLGCDAYIIDRDHLYYVSMGSAATRTAAEALYRQITSWYNGSVAIQEW